VGTPVSGQLAQFTGATTIQGVAAGQIPGTATNDNATAGNVGEIITATKAVGSAVSIPTSGTTVNVTSISLTAGDWEVHGNVCYSNTGTTPVAAAGGLSTTSATLPTPGVEGYFQLSVSFLVGGTNCFPTGNVRVSLSGTTTYFLTALANYTGTAPAAYGTITARRAR
jgi:hypothetical protein